LKFLEESRKICERKQPKMGDESLNPGGGESEGCGDRRSAGGYRLNKRLSERKGGLGIMVPLAFTVKESGGGWKMDDCHAKKSTTSLLDF